MDSKERFLDALKRHKRLAVAGVPESGKTTVWCALVTDRPVVHTDDFLAAGWDACPVETAKATPSGPVVIEGVRALATLRELKEPVTCVVWCNDPLGPVASNQRGMVAGRRTNFKRWLEKGGADDVELVRL